MSHSLHNDSPPLRLRMESISKSFPGVQALREVTVEVHRGEVLAIVGENGAGKSTLIKILGGAIEADHGRLELDGQPVHFPTPRHAMLAGIGIIYQEFNLIPALSIRENLFLGRGQQRWGAIDRAEETRQTRHWLDQLGLELDPETPVRGLSIAQQQLVEIAKSLSLNVSVLVMDEPTATLTPSEVDRLFGIVRRLQQRGLAVIYISHRLDELPQIADRVFVLRDGQPIATAPIASLSRQFLIEKMVGRNIADEFPKRSAPRGPACLRAAGLGWGRKVDDVDLNVHTGEILGITGLIGAGRTELGQLLAGVRRPDRGRLWIHNRPVSFHHPRDAIAAGIGMLPEDRQAQGLILQHALQDNFSLPNLDQFSRWGVLSPALERRALMRHVNELRIKIASPNQPAGQLSGGNQQKLVLAKWLERHCEILIIDEPTRGIDVGAKLEIYEWMNRLTAAGKAIIMISSELPEVIGMSDRIMVMRQGRLVHQFENAQQATQASIMEHAAG